MAGSNGNYVPMQRYAQIVGWGMAVPDRIVTNQDLEQIVDTNDEWIRSRTGIQQRRIAVDPAETTATLGTKAARAALEVADVPAAKLDLIICSTSSPEHIFPSTASLIQDALGATGAGATAANAQRRAKGCGYYRRRRQAGCLLGIAGAGTVATAAGKP